MIHKGSFNVRISPERHKQLAIKASKEGVSLNSAVDAAIGMYLKGEPDIKTEIESVLGKYIESNNYKTSIAVSNKASNIIPFDTKYVYKEG